MTTAQAAEALGITRRRVLQLIAKELLRSEKRGRDHWIESAELERFRQLPRPMGWKLGRKRNTPDAARE